MMCNLHKYLSHILYATPVINRHIGGHAASRPFGNPIGDLQPSLFDNDSVNNGKPFRIIRRDKAVNSRMGTFYVLTLSGYYGRTADAPMTYVDRAAIPTE